MMRRLLAAGALEPLDRQLAATLARLVPAAGDAVLLAAALASRAVQRGHVCLDLARLCVSGCTDEDGQRLDVELPPLADWRRCLAESSLVCAGAGARAPLVLDGDRLYLYRYWDYQRRLAAALRTRAAIEERVEVAAARAGIERLFGVPGGPDAQRLAAAVALLRRFTLVSGGPGTGKTSTVARILALLAEQAVAPLRIALCAPTGKAAQRLGEALAHGVANLPIDPAIARTLALEARTLHRLLGFQPRTPTRFKHGLDRPLAADVVVVDEASMVDLALMTKLVEATAPDARLILLGDRDQLASVEAGAILGDLDDDEHEAGYSESFARQAEALTGQPVPAAHSRAPGVHDCMVRLHKSYRYREHGGIGALARAVKAGDADGAIALLRGGGEMPYGDVSLAPLDERDPLGGALGRAVIEAFVHVRQEQDARARLERIGHFRVLCAHRRGPLGADALGLSIEQRLRAQGLVRGEGAYYDGRPILIVRNDYALELYNGDIGVVCSDGGTRVCFASRHGIRAFAPSRLPPHQTAFTMTVHKSQGSELERVALLLPREASPILTRELLYTGISRARAQVDLYGSEQVLRAALARRVDRASGLREALWR